MNFTKSLPILLISILSGCVSTDNAYQKAKTLKYEVEPNQSRLINIIEKRIRPNLKDPDSLKNLRVSSYYKCYASTIGFTDNTSPKYDYGYWCYNFSYNATNSYGGYVQGNEFIIYYQDKLYTIAGIDEVVRKIDDVWVYHTN